MTKDEVRAGIEKLAIIPAIRVSSREDALFACEAVALGGIPIAELTMTVPGAVDLLGALRNNHPGLIVGAGTVLDLETAERCLDQGPCSSPVPAWKSSWWTSPPGTMCWCCRAR